MLVNVPLLIQVTSLAHVSSCLNIQTLALYSTYFEHKVVYIFTELRDGCISMWGDDFNGVCKECFFLHDHCDVPQTQSHL